eukprot:TRINITY_DN8271_c0_g1_i3.p1 TRINITY_DN8271_c0_g1~~TRINITY_DN8271_c0_g1_i3.p1  ORF type:complete len:141 (-),score=21.02 TRINITY_DN8271_c0_g1_i3:61-483(-)
MNTSDYKNHGHGEGIDTHEDEEIHSPKEAAHTGDLSQAENGLGGEDSAPKSKKDDIGLDYNEIKLMELEQNHNHPPDMIIEPEYIPIPKKTVLLTVFLLLVGLAFLIAGLVTYFTDDRQKGLLFLIFGGILSVPLSLIHI